MLIKHDNMLKRYDLITRKTSIVLRFKCLVIAIRYRAAQDKILTSSLLLSILFTN